MLAGRMSQEWNRILMYNPYAKNQSDPKKQCACPLPFIAALQISCHFHCIFRYVCTLRNLKHTTEGIPGALSNYLKNLKF
jgi:hypothetical protein